MQTLSSKYTLNMIGVRGGMMVWWKMNQKRSRLRSDRSVLLHPLFYKEPLYKEPKYRRPRKFRDVILPKRELVRNFSMLITFITGNDQEFDSRFLSFGVQNHINSNYACIKCILDISRAMLPNKCLCITVMTLHVQLTLRN